MNIGLMVPLAGNLPAPTTIIDQVVKAESLGFRSVWTPNVGGNDALTVLAAAGLQTTLIELGTFVVPTYLRHPVALAQQALTTNALVGGRLTLGIGLSHRVVIEDRLGLDWSHPIRHLREYLACLQPLLDGETANFQGAEYQVKDYSLTIPNSTPLPVLVAAMGPQMLRLTGARTAGTAIWLAGPKYLAEHVVPVLGAAAQNAGRPAPRIVVGLPVCVTDHPQQAAAYANKTLAGYGQLPSYRAILDKEGAANVADVALIGDAQTVQERVRQLFAAGMTDLAASVFALPDEQPTHTYEVLAALQRS